MVKPLNEFGGWLRFFYVTLWISLVACIVQVVCYLIVLFYMADLVHLIGPFLLILRAIAVAFLFGWIIRIVKKNDSAIPGKVLGVMTWYLWGSLGVYLFVSSWECFALGVVPLNVVLKYGKIILSLLIWYSIWSTYLKKSKRVLAYYGKNAGKL